MNTIIKFPNLSTKNALEVCRTLDEKVCTGEVILDFSETGSFHPTGMLMVSSAVRAFMRRNNLNARQIGLEFGTNNSKNISYANHMGFFESMGFYNDCPFFSYSSNTCIPIRLVNMTDLVKEEHNLTGKWLDDGPVIERAAKKLAVVLSQGNEELVKLFTYVLREIIRNIPEHSNSKNIWFCGQYWRTRDQAEIAILDEGIGIYNSLRSNAHYRNNVDNEIRALRLAIEPGVSKAFSPGKSNPNKSEWGNSGFGLFMVKNICTSLGGSFGVFSKCKGIRCYSDTKTISCVNTAIPGTAISVLVKPSMLTNYASLIKNIRILGEEEAKGEKDRFHRASKPSQGLMT